MRVASALGFGTNPEAQAWGRLLDWAEESGALNDNREHRFFGFNNPDPSYGSPNYGYEQWVTVGEETEGADKVEIEVFEGGLYAVARCKGVQNIGECWKSLVRWREDSSHQPSSHQWLEELINAPDVAPEEMIFDLYLPIME
jgi:DNA gyrase inhibitor GyrI